MMTPELLQDLSALHGGMIPDVVDLTDTDKERISLDVLRDDDTEAMEYLQENGELAILYFNSPEEAVRELQNAIWCAIEDSVRRQIENHNETADLTDDQLAIGMAALDGETV